MDEKVELMVTEENNIQNLIYNIRGKQVMLDIDLAVLYQVETYRINEAGVEACHMFFIEQLMMVLLAFMVLKIKKCK